MRQQRQPHGQPSHVQQLCKWALCENNAEKSLRRRKLITNCNSNCNMYFKNNTWSSCHTRGRASPAEQGAASVLCVTLMRQLQLLFAVIKMQLSFVLVVVTVRPAPHICIAPCSTSWPCSMLDMARHNYLQHATCWRLHWLTQFSANSIVIACGNVT